MVVVTTPTDLKSFMLKFVELTHLLEERSHGRVQSQASGASALPSPLLYEQAHLWTRIGQLLRASILLMDEVRGGERVRARVPHGRPPLPPRRARRWTSSCTRCARS